MRAIDTNVIVRYLLGDDPKQADTARHLIGQEPVFVPRTVLLEVEWVLRSVYDQPAEQTLAALRAFAGLPNVMLEDAGLAAQAMDWAETGVDFADALHLAACNGCEGFVTFDRSFARAGTRLSGIPISTP